MKIACFGDLHAHKFKEFDVRTDESGSQRLDNIINTLRYIRKWCNENRIYLVLFSGDLYHARGRVDTEVLNFVSDEIEQFEQDGIFIVMIAGNHDQYDNSDVPENSLHSLKKLSNVIVYDTVGRYTAYHNTSPYEGEKVEIILAPYSKNAQLVKDYIAKVEKKDFPQILLFHLGISGGFVGSGSYPMADAFEVEDLRPDLFRYVIGGHFHKRQFLGNLPNAFYCGAPIQHSFGDEGEDKGFYVVDTNELCSIEFIPIPNPQFLTFSGDVQDMTEDYLSYADNRGDYVRFLVTAEQLEDYKDIIPANLHYKVELQKEYVEQSRMDVKIGMSFEEIVTKYAEENNPDAIAIGLEILREVENE